MRIRDFFLSPFSIYSPQGQPCGSLSSSKKKEIILVTVISGLLTAGLAAPIVFFGLSYKYRIRMIKTLNIQDQKTAATANSVLHPSSSQNEIFIKNLLLKDLLSINTPPMQRALCDRKDGMTCFLNTALQTMAQLPYYRRLFDPTHVLIPLPDETKEQFAKRQQFQSIGNQLLFEILSGEKRVSGLKEFLESLRAADPRLPAIENMLAGDDARAIMMSVIRILLPPLQAKTRTSEADMISLGFLRSNLAFLEMALKVISNKSEWKPVLQASYPLHPLPAETPEQFSYRQEAQALLHLIIPQILSNKKDIEQLEIFYNLLRKCNSFVLPPLHKNLLTEDPSALITAVITCILFPLEQKNMYSFPHPFEAPYVVPYQKKMNEAQTKPPPEVFQLTASSTEMPPLEFDTHHGLYRLELLTTTGGHATTLIREDDQHFVQLDDLKQAPKRLSIENVNALLSRSPWQNAYYIQVKPNLLPENPISY